MPWEPGKSGNARGRPKNSLAAAVRRIVQVDELARAVYDIAFGEGVKLGEITMPATFEQRRWAIEWLSDRGYGKPVQSVELDAVVSGGESTAVDMSKLTTEELKGMVLLLEKVVPPPGDEEPEPIA